MSIFGLPVVTVLLLVLSNVFMTVAWYGHLKFDKAPMWQAILACWAIALLEYCLQVPANRMGYMNHITPSQLKVVQECITLIVFAVFSTLYFREQFHWNHLVSALLLVGAVYFAFQKVA